MLIALFVGHTHQEQDIYVAIPPPLITPLARQAQGAVLGLHLPTPGSSTHSSSGPHWPSQDPVQPVQGEGPIRAQQDALSTGAPVSPVSPTGISLPAQLLNRLYPFSAMATPSTDVSCASSSSQESSRPNANVLSSFGVGGSSRQSYLPYSVLRSDLNNNGSNGISSEQTRTAAVTAIANTLQQRDGRLLRGDSPYIPSSLSMLFSDPEVMQQEALGSAGLHDPQEQPSALPRQFSRSRRPFRNRDHGQEDSDLSCVDGSYSDEYEDEDEDVDEAQKLIRSKDRRGYEYEIVQDEPIFSYAAMIREEYIAPHEPSSSSPLFPSPLTTLGRFAPGAILVPTDGRASNLCIFCMLRFIPKTNTTVFFLLSNRSRPKWEDMAGLWDNGQLSV